MRGENFSHLGGPENGEDVIFEGRKTIRMGSRRVELTDAGGSHSDEGDLFVHLPDDRFLMVVDTLAPGLGEHRSGHATIPAEVEPDLGR